MLDVSTDAVISALAAVAFDNYLVIVLKLPLHQQFEKQKFASAIESASDLDEIKGVAAMLLNLYYKQLSATIDIVEGKMS